MQEQGADLGMCQFLLSVIDLVQGCSDQDRPTDGEEVSLVRFFLNYRANSEVKY